MYKTRHASNEIFSGVLVSP